MTKPVASAFHCERRLRVFERDILRLGTAMTYISLIRGVAAQGHLDAGGRHLHFRIAAHLGRLQNRPGPEGAYPLTTHPRR